MANHSATAALKVSGTAQRGSTFVIDDQNNSSVSIFAGYLLLPMPVTFPSSPPWMNLASAWTSVRNR